MHSYLEFNVSLNGKHFFATSDRSCNAYDTVKAKQLATVLADKFPESEGYEISATRWEGQGHFLNVKALISDK